MLSLQDGDLSGTAGLPLTDLDVTGAIEAEAGDADSELIELDPEELAARLEELSKRLERELDAAGLNRDREQVHYYDEWDHELGGYRRRWCHLREKTIEPPPADGVGVVAASGGRFVDETRRHHADLLRRVRRQFELLKPEEFRRVRRLIEGEELDLDRVVETHVDRRAGRPPDGAVYMSRRRQHRDVAAAFLLDMSASTDAEAPVDEPEHAPGKDAGARVRGCLRRLRLAGQPAAAAAGPQSDRHREGVARPDGRRAGDRLATTTRSTVSPVSAARRSSSSLPRSSMTTSTATRRTGLPRWNRSAAPGWDRRSATPR